MKKYNLITPEGTRDLLFEESVARRILQEKLNTLFTTYGYSEVITPTIEFYDVFSSNVRHFSQESMYKLTDNKGRLLVIRPDSTLPIARLVSTRVKEQPLPLKLFYNQNIFRANPKNSGRDDEISQSGIELIGGDEKAADFEAVSIALEVLENLNGKSYRLEIGNVEIFKLLMKQLNECIEINEEMFNEISYFTETKNYPELDRLLNIYPQNDTVAAIKALPKMFGGSEIFDKMRGFLNTPELLTSLEKTENLYKEICCYLENKNEQIYVDFGMISKIDFYSGMVFRGLIEGHGTPVLSGGRYDNLFNNFGADLPATGFAVNNNAAIDVYLTNNKNAVEKEEITFIFIESSGLANGMKFIKKMTENGKRIYNLPVKNKEEAIEYAKKKGISALLIISGKDTEVTKIKIL